MAEAGALFVVMFIAGFVAAILVVIIVAWFHGYPRFNAHSAKALQAWSHKIGPADEKDEFVHYSIQKGPPQSSSSLQRLEEEKTAAFGEMQEAAERGELPPAVGLPSFAADAAPTRSDVNRPGVREAPGGKAPCPPLPPPCPALVAPPGHTPRQLYDTLLRLLKVEASADPVLREHLDRLRHHVSLSDGGGVGGGPGAVPAHPPRGAHAYFGGGLRAAALGEDDTDCSDASLTLKGASGRTLSTETRTPNSSDSTGSDGIRILHEDPAETLAVPSPPAMPSVAVPPPFRGNLEFGPTEQQVLLLEPPLQLTSVIDERVAENTSLATLRRILGKRDAQTTELHRQLRETRKSLFAKTSEASVATARLNQVLADPARAPVEQAEALRTLQVNAADLSGRLSEARQQEAYWCAIAKRQRLFLFQNERMLAQENATTAEIFKRHPAGEVFFAPPPLPLDEDSGGDSQRDLSRSHCDPYSVDSWPFEPNASAQRNQYESKFQPLEEDEAEGSLDEVELDDSDDKDNSLSGYSGDLHRPGDLTDGGDDVVDDEEDLHTYERRARDERARTRQDEDENFDDPSDVGAPWPRGGGAGAPPRGMPPLPGVGPAAGSDTARSL